MNTTSSTPDRAFSTLGLSAELLTVLAELEFKQMTDIQYQAIPPLLAGKDFVGQSETGSGKTAAFGLPLLEKIILKPRTLQALILCPTRELCAQVAKQIRVLGRRHQGLHVLTLTGGQGLWSQVAALRKGVHIVVATPGRLVDHLGRQSIDLRRIKTLVLDEADRMLDMGFEEDMEKIVAGTPKNRQTVLFSATMPEQLDALVQKLLTTPVKVKIHDEAAKTPEIDQSFFVVREEEKLDTLLSLLADKQPDSTLVFSNFKASVKQITKALEAQNISVASLHGDLEQNDRDREMEKFRNKSTRVLIATDVAARGLDIEDLDLVVNFDFPKQPETYVHRIGRTARAGKNGSAISFLHPKEQSRIQRIETLTGQKYTLKDRPKLKSNITATLPSKMKTLYISGGRKNKIRPTDILGALTGDAGRLQGSQIGKIAIQDWFTYVAVESAIAKKALDGLRIGKIKGRKFKIEFVK